MRNKVWPKLMAMLAPIVVKEVIRVFNEWWDGGYRW
jgi:hypothetical protein